MDIISVVGLSALLIAFILLKIKIIKIDDICYNFLNLTGAFILTWYAFKQQSWIFVILEATWGLVAILGIFEAGKERKMHRDLTDNNLSVSTVVQRLRL